MNRESLVNELLNHIWDWVDAEKACKKFGRDEISLDEYRRLLGITYNSRLKAVRIAKKIRREDGQQK
jgi:hypothetical protein